jgi:hypothetical protein
VLINTLLHPDRLVRVAAASLAFNVGAWVQRGRVARVRGKEVLDGIRDGEEDGEWEVELVSAVVEALASEEESEDAGEWSPSPPIMLLQVAQQPPSPPLFF